MSATPYYTDGRFTLYQGDNAQLFSRIEAAIDCIVTSPPYYGLRDYGTGNWEGGTEGCDHESARKRTRYDYSLASSPLQSASRTGTDAQPAMFAEVCPACGATRVDDQIGLEAVVDDYIDKLVGVFVAARPHLKPTATIWVNLGDKYIDKELTGAPWLFAFAMKKAGFNLLLDVIWSKPNPQPTSQKHRPSVAHEYIFMFGVGRNYYGYDAVKERMAASSIGRMKSPRYDSPENKGFSGEYAVQAPEFTDAEKEGWRNMRSVWEIPTESFPGTHYAVFPKELVKKCILAGCPVGGMVCDPFIGSGTTAVVARTLGCKSIGIELKPEYCYDAVRRYQGRSLVLEEAGQISFFDQEDSSEASVDTKRDDLELRDQHSESRNASASSPALQELALYPSL